MAVTPSPFSPNDDGEDDVTWIHYRLGRAVAMVRIRVFDLNGRAVRVLEEAHLSGPEGSIIWDGRSDTGAPLPTGIYVLSLEAIAAESGTFERQKGLVTVVGTR